MKKYLFLALLVPALAACDLFGPTSPLSDTCYTDPQPEGAAQLALGSEDAAYVPGRLLVSYRGGADTLEPAGARKGPGALRAARSVRQSYGLTTLGTLGTDGLSEVVRVPSGASVSELADALRRDPRVRYAEPDYYLRPLSAPAPGTPPAALPDDPLLNEQWHLLGFGVPAAWQLETGKRNVVLAILDSGVDLTHEDIRGRTLPGCLRG